MPKSRFNNEYSPLYVESVFAVWQMNNKPNMGVLYTMIDPDEEGNKPEPSTLSAWKSRYAWESRDLAIQAEVQQKTDRELVNIRMKMMKRHAERAQQIGEMAFEYLRDTGFDSSASAVSAAFKAFEEEKKSTGMEVALTQVFSMSDDDLQKTMNRLLARTKGLNPEDGDDIVTAESEELDNAPSDDKTT